MVSNIAIRYTQRLAEAEAVRSVGSKGDSYDNAAAESLNSLYKREFRDFRRGWQGAGDVMTGTADWVHWHNEIRLHSYCGDMPPKMYEEIYYKALASGKPSAVWFAAVRRCLPGPSALSVACARRLPGRESGSWRVLARMGIVIAVIAALAAACCFAAAAVAQHGTARAAGERGVRLLLVLVRQPRWLAAAALGGLSFAIQGLALAFGPLALVQPLAATDVLFALPMIAVLHGYRPSRGDWAGAAAVAAGIAVFLAVSPPSTGISAPGARAWVPAMVAVAVLVCAAAFAAARARGRAQVIALAAAAGITFGLLDALTKSSVDLLAERGMAVLLRWEPYALLAAGLAGALLSQNSFRAGALSVSLPVIDTLEPVSAVVIAATVFGERLAATPGQLAAQLAGGAMAVAGIAALSRSSIAAAETRRKPHGGAPQVRGCYEPATSRHP